MCIRGKEKERKREKAKANGKGRFLQLTHGFSALDLRSSVRHRGGIVVVQKPAAIGVTRTRDVRHEAKAENIPPIFCPCETDSNTRHARET